MLLTRSRGGMPERGIELVELKPGGAGERVDGDRRDPDAQDGLAPAIRLCSKPRKLLARQRQQRRRQIGQPGQQQRGGQASAQQPFTLDSA